MRDKAFSHLENSIAHQGWASPSAAETAPFLIELACAGRVEERARIVRLIGDLSVGGMHTEHLEHGYVYSPHGDDLEWLDRLRAAITSARERIIALYREREAAIRAAVSLVLGMMGEHAAEVIVPVRHVATKDRSSVVRASALVALGILGRNLNSRADAELLAEAMRAKASAVRVAAAVGLSYVASPMRADVVGVLAAAAREADRVAGFPWVGGDIANLASRVLTLRGGASSLLEYLISARPAAPNDAAATIAQGDTARQIMALAFPEPLRAGTTPDDLTELQRRVVTSLSERALLWDERRTVEIGLPKAPEEARAWLGIPPPPQPPTLLDQTLEWKGRFAPVREVWLAVTSSEPAERARLIRALHDRFDTHALFGLWLDTHKRIRYWLCGPRAVELQIELLISLGEPAVELVRAQIAEVKKWGPPLARIQNQKGDWFTTNFARLTGWYGVFLAVMSSRRGSRPDDDAYDCMMQEISGIKGVPQVVDALGAFELERRIELVLRPHRGDYWYLAPSVKVTEWAHYYLTRIPTAESVQASKHHFDRYVEALRSAGDDASADALDAAVAARLA